jgi:hypothetical protein
VVEADAARGFACIWSTGFNTQERKTYTLAERVKEGESNENEKEDA